MIISMIAAMGSNRVIGKDNDLPWHLPDDFQYFKDTTNGHAIIMGRKNWESLPKSFRPLPNRINIVVTRQKDYSARGAEVVSGLEAAVTLAKKKTDQDELFIIGGGEIYRQGLELTDRIYLTEINGAFEGQTTFPELNHDQWKEKSRIHHPSDSKHSHSFDFVIYLREK
ncbi:MAG: dihydrofolate reductase [Bacteroidota bacterium]